MARARPTAKSFQVILFHCRLSISAQSTLPDLAGDQCIVIRKPPEILEGFREQCETLGPVPRIGVVGTLSWLTKIDEQGLARYSEPHLKTKFRGSFWINWPNYLK